MQFIARIVICSAAANIGACATAQDTELIHDANLGKFVNTIGVLRVGSKITVKVKDANTFTHTYTLGAFPHSGQAHSFSAESQCCARSVQFLETRTGGAYGTRTRGLFHAMEALSQLS